MRSIEITDPLWILLENVDMGDGSEADSNCAVVTRVLKDAGFENRVMAWLAYTHTTTPPPPPKKKQKKTSKPNHKL